MRITFGIQVLVATVVLTVLTYAGWAIANEILFRQQAQPINFPHDRHVGIRKIACVYCHRGVFKGDIAGVPSVQECMDCHQVVLKDSPEIKKLAAHWDAKDPSKSTPINWFKVYKLPEHVRFTHQAHINRGIECASCNGKVEEMAVLTQSSRPIPDWIHLGDMKSQTYGHNPTMGWCVTCHRQNNAPTDCTTCHK